MPRRMRLHYSIMKLPLVLVLFVALLLLLTLTSSGWGRDDGDRIELTVSAAISLADSLQDIQTAYEQLHPRVKIRYNFGASGALRQQIEQGAPVDLFLSADEAEMDRLVRVGLVDQHTELCTNQVVLIVPRNRAKVINSIEDLAASPVQNIAVGHPQTVPAGAYAKEALEKLGVWETVQNKVVYSQNVRQVLAYVESGNADAGFVYETDARKSDKAAAVLAIDPMLHRPIRYMAGVVYRSQHAKQAEDFFQYLQESEAAVLFSKHGFQNVEQSGGGR